MQYQTITLPIVAGISTKTDPLANQPPQLNTLINGSFQTVGSIQKRFGYDSLNNATSSDGFLTNSIALGTLKNELLQFDGSDLFSYSPSIQTWIDKGPCNSFRATQFQVERTAATLTLADIAVVNNVALFAYTSSLGGIYISVVDLVSGTQFQTNVLLDPNAFFAKCYVIGPDIWVAVAQAPEVRVYQIASFAPLTFSGSTAPLNNLGAAGLFDITNFNSSSALIAWADTSNIIHVGYLTQSGFLGDVVNGYPDPFVTAETATTALGVALNLDMSQIAVSYANTTQYMRFFSSYSTLSGYAIAPSTLSGTMVSILRTTLAIDPSGDFWTVYWTYDGVDDSTNYTYTCPVESDGGVGTATQLYRSLTLVSKAFAFGAHSYVVCEFTGGLQAAYFVVRDDGLLMTRLLGSTAGAIESQSILSNVPITSAGVAYCAVTKISLTSGINCLVFDFNYPGIFIQAEIGGVDLIGGGILKLYDGAQVTEQSFLQWPEFPLTPPDQNPLPHATGGSMSDGSYFYKAIYEWYDAKGNYYQSTVSNQSLEVVITGSSDAGSVTVTISTLRVSMKSNVTIGLYRKDIDTSDNFIRVTTINNNPDVDTVTYLDITASLLGNTALYTDTGEYDNDPSPSCTSLVVGKTRIFLVDDETGSLWPSKPFTPGFGIGFSAFTTLQIDGFNPQAVAVLDDKVLLFDANRTFWFTGDGPDPAGQGGYFTPPQILSTDVGCANSASICRGPDGIYFQSAKGICYVSRQLEASYIGAPVEAYNSFLITATTVIPKQNQIRFLTQDGPCLVYDYYVGQWMTFEPHSGSDSVIWNNVYTYLRNTGQTFVQNTGYLDDGNPYNLTIATSWINLQQYQGFKRIRRATFLGTYFGPTTLSINIYYDYNDAYFDPLSYDTSLAISPSVYGDGFYGEDEVYGSIVNAVLEGRISIPRQKITSIRFEIIDTINTGNSVSIAGIDIEIGSIGGLARLPARQSL